MNEEQRQLLRAIGRQGISPEQLREQFGSAADTSELIALGLVSLREIALYETTGPGAAAVPPITYYALTAKGAEAIGLDPRLLAA
jgi:hypothetical protein